MDTPAALPTIRVYDATVQIHAAKPLPPRVRGRWGFEPAWPILGRVVRTLRAEGFLVIEDPRIARDYPILRRQHRYGRHGDLQCTIAAHPVHVEVAFFQDVVFTNLHGGRHDFHRRQKMPYLIGKRFERTLLALRTAFATTHVPEVEPPSSPNPDPLAYFNGSWDGEYERRLGVHRFPRGEDGWPTAEALGNSNRQDRDKQPIEQGSLLYWRDMADGRLRRGRAWGGINGMWTMVYGPGPRDHTCISSWELFRCEHPAALRGRWFPPEKRRKRLEREKERAVKAERFERAAVLRDALARQVAT